MRKVILEVGPATVTAVNDPNLKALVDLCPEYKDLQPGTTKDGYQVLVKNPNAEGGVTYIYPNYTFRRFKKDGTPSDKPTGSVKLCEAATGKISPAFGPDQRAKVEELKKTNKYVELSSEIIGKIPNEYKPIDLSTLDPGKFKQPNTWFLYEKVGVYSENVNIPEVVESAIKKYNKTFIKPKDIDKLNMAEKIATAAPALLRNKDVMDWAAKQYPGKPLGDILVYPVEAEAGTKQLNPANKEACKPKIKKLYGLSVCNQKPQGRGNCSAQIKQMGSELDKLKKEVAQCLSNGLMFRQFMGIGLKKEVNVLGNTESPDYDNQLGVGREIAALSGNDAGSGYSVNESYDRHLRKLIRENLMIIAKKKSTLNNKTVIRERFLKIANSKLNKTDKINRIVSEGYLMVNSGVNKKLINEEFSWLSNLLGLGGEGVISTFKTNIAKKIIDKFIPDGSKSWLGGIAANAIGNIPLGDYFNGNILKCDFVSGEITKSITEEVVTKVQQNKDLNGGFYDVIKNSLVEYIDDTPFFNKIQEGISNMICPYMEDISGSLGKAFGHLTDEVKNEFTGSK